MSPERDFKQFQTFLSYLLRRFGDSLRAGILALFVWTSIIAWTPSYILDSVFGSGFAESYLQSNPFGIVAVVAFPVWMITMLFALFVAIQMIRGLPTGTAKVFVAAATWDFLVSVVNSAGPNWITLTSSVVLLGTFATAYLVLTRVGEAATPASPPRVFPQAKCYVCGHKVEATQRFCPNCGALIGNRDTETKIY